MDHSQRLSFGEFLKDLRLVVSSPARRFAVIRERGVRWGSLVLLVVPTYLGFGYLGGLYFESDPFPGYSFVPPLIAAFATVYLKLYLIHIFARAFQGRKRLESLQGSFRDLVVVFGYTGVPVILVLMLALTLFLLLPQEMGYFTREYGAVGVSIMVALSVSLFIWNLILIVLALRAVYALRDLKIVASFFLGSALLAIPGIGTMWFVAPAKVDLEYLQPILSARIVRFLASDPTSSISKNTKITVHIDRVAYRVRAPKRSEIIAFLRKQPDPESKERKRRFIYGPQWFVRWEGGEQSIGRIVGLPGEIVEVVNGRVTVNGETWEEPYIRPEFRSDASMPPRTLGPAEYLVLPENRLLMDKLKDELVVTQNRITGREMIPRWPLGWWSFSPTVFRRAGPLGSARLMPDPSDQDIPLEVPPSAPGKYQK